MRKRLLIVTGLVCCIGTALASFSLVQHFRLAKEGFARESYCAISDKINCDLVNASSYSEIFGTPIAWWGILYYGLLATMAFWSALSPRKHKSTIIFAELMALAGIPVCLLLAYISVFIIGSICLECMGMYFVTFFAAIAFFFALKTPLRNIFSLVINYIKAILGMKNKLGFKHRFFAHLAFVCLVFGIGWLSILHIQAGEDKISESKISTDELVKSFYLQPVHNISIDPASASWGNPKAKVKIIEFSEYQCPFCKIASFNVRPFLYEFRKDIVYYFVNYPLDSACNPSLSHPMHPIACYLSKAGLCAEKEGEFWKYHDELFRNQKNLSKKLAPQIAEDEFGWDSKKFQNCINSADIDNQLKAEISSGLQLKIKGTPSLYLNGRKIHDWRNKEFLRTLVKMEIQRLSKQ